MESASDIYKRLNSIQLNQSDLADVNARSFYLYGHSTISGPNQPNYTWQDGSLRFNLVQSVVDTLANKISKNSPRPTFLTDNGDWGMRQKAIKREKFVFGQFMKSKIYDQTKAALYDCLIYGDGFVKVYSEHKDLKISRVNRLELFVDEMESINGSPRSMYQVCYADKAGLQAMYPDKAKQIDAQNSVLPPFYMSAPNYQTVVQVVEYWKLPTKDSKGKLIGGEHHLLVGDVSLVSEEYEREKFPFAKIGFIPNVVGYWSKGVAETILDDQVELNRSLRTMSASFRLAAIPTVIYDVASGIIKGQFSNDVGRMISYDGRTGQAPQFFTPVAVNSDLMNHVNQTIERAYGKVGLSQLTAQSMKPAGLNSGKALREYNDLETERFAALAKSWENLHMQLAELCLLEGKDITEKYGKYAVLAPDKKGCSLINFKDIDMDDDTYYIQVYPSSMLPKTPSGRLEYVQELIGSGMVDPQTGLSLLEFPDIEKYARLETAPKEDILATIDYMLDSDEYLPPETFQDLQYGIKMMNSAYLRYKHEGCPEEKLDLLIRWINDAMVLMQPPEEPEMTSSDLVAPAVNEMATDSAVIDEQLAQEQMALEQIPGEPGVI